MTASVRTAQACPICGLEYLHRSQPKEGGFDYVHEVGESFRDVCHQSSESANVANVFHPRGWAMCQCGATIVNVSGLWLHLEPPPQVCFFPAPEE